MGVLALTSVAYPVVPFAIWDGSEWVQIHPQLWDGIAWRDDVRRTVTP